MAKQTGRGDAAASAARNPRRWDFAAMSQGQARRRVFDGGYVLISIQDLGEPLTDLPTPHNCHGLLRLRFDDIERPRLGFDLFTREQAQEILDFVHAHADAVATIACHCKAGMCRSPAVLGALAELMGQDQGFLSDHRGRPKYRPNRYVRDTLVREGRRHPVGTGALPQDEGVDR